MNLLGHDERERLLAAAWDEACAAYPLPGFPALRLRPFSANALRRAATMSLRCLVGDDFRAALAGLSPSVALGEIEALAWLLSADLEEVRSAMRQRAWASALDRYTLPLAAVAPMRAEMARVLALVHATLFTTEEKPKTPLPSGRSLPPEPEPPAHLVAPGTVATLAFALAEKVGRPADELLEWIPACQIFQLAHCLQWGNTQIWTVDPSKIAEDPYEGLEPDPDPGFGEEIAF